MTLKLLILACVYQASLSSATGSILPFLPLYLRDVGIRSAIYVGLAFASTSVVHMITGGLMLALPPVIKSAVRSVVIFASLVLSALSLTGLLLLPSLLKVGDVGMYCQANSTQNSDFLWRRVRSMEEVGIPGGAKIMAEKEEQVQLKSWHLSRGANQVHAIFRRSEEQSKSSVSAGVNVDVLVLAVVGVMAVGAILGSTGERLTEETFSEFLSDGADVERKEQSLRITTGVGLGVGAVSAGSASYLLGCIHIFTFSTAFAMNFFLALAIHVAAILVLPFFSNVPVSKNYQTTLREKLHLFNDCSSLRNTLYFLGLFVMGLSTAAIQIFLPLKAADLGASLYFIGLLSLIPNLASIVMVVFESQMLRITSLSRMGLFCCVLQAIRLAAHGAISLYWLMLPVELLSIFSATLFSSIVKDNIMYMAIPGSHVTIQFIIQLIFYKSGFACGSVLSGLLQDRFGVDIMLYSQGGVVALYCALFLPCIHFTRKEFGEQRRKTEPGTTARPKIEVIKSFTMPSEPSNEVSNCSVEEDNTESQNPAKSEPVGAGRSNSLAVCSETVYALMRTSSVPIVGLPVADESLLTLHIAESATGTNSSKTATGISEDLRVLPKETGSSSMGTTCEEKEIVSGKGKTEISKKSTFDTPVKKKRSSLKSLRRFLSRSRTRRRQKYAETDSVKKKENIESPCR